MEIHHLVWMPRESKKKQKRTLSFPLFYFLSLNVLAHVILASKNRRVSFTDFFKSLECSLGDTKIMSFKIQILFTAFSDLGFLFLFTGENGTVIYIYIYIRGIICRLQTFRNLLFSDLTGFFCCLDVHTAVK
jgi:hypothetical protein